MLDRAVPTLMLVREDDSARLATDDLIRALSVAALVLVVIGVPLGGRPEPVRGGAAAPARGGIGRRRARRRARAPAHDGPAEVAEASAAFNAMAAEVDATRAGPAAPARRRAPRPAHAAHGHRRLLGGAPRRDRQRRGGGAGCRRRSRTRLGASGACSTTSTTSRSRARDAPPLRIEPLDGVRRWRRAAVERFAGEAEARGQHIAFSRRAARRLAAAAHCSADRDASTASSATSSPTRSPSRRRPAGTSASRWTSSSVPMVGRRRPSGRSRHGRAARRPHRRPRRRAGHPARGARPMSSIASTVPTRRVRRAARASGLAIVRDLAEALGRPRLRGEPRRRRGSRRRRPACRASSGPSVGGSSAGLIASRARPFGGELDA